MKHIKFVIILFCTLFIINSCKKNILHTEQNNKTIKPVCFSDRISELGITEDSILLFRNDEEFDLFISNIKEINDSTLLAEFNSLGFVPYYHQIFHDTVVGDLLLNFVLNKNAMITIADTTYKVVFDNYTINVYGTYPSNRNNIRDLMSLNLSNPNIHIFARNMITTDTTENPPVLFGNGGDCALSKSSKDKKTKYNVNNITYRVKSKQMYVDAFFYKELSVKVKSDRKTGTGTWQDQVVPYLGIQSYYKYKPRNKEYSLGNAYQQNTNTKDLKLTIYAGSRCLSEYYVDATTYYVKYGDTYNFQTQPNSIHLDALFYDLGTCY